MKLCFVWFLGDMNRLKLMWYFICGVINIELFDLMTFFVSSVFITIWESIHSIKMKKILMRVVSGGHKIKLLMTHSICVIWKSCCFDRILLQSFKLWASDSTSTSTGDEWGKFHEKSLNSLRNILIWHNSIFHNLLFISYGTTIGHKLSISAQQSSAEWHSLNQPKPQVAYFGLQFMHFS